MKASLIFILFLTFIVSACRTSRPASSGIKTNGLYYFYDTKTPTHFYECYRFYADGTVINGSFSRPPAEIWNTFIKSEAFSYPQSTYEIKKNKISMVFYNEQHEKTHEMKGILYNDKIIFTVYHQTSEPGYIYEEELEVNFLPLK